MNLAEDIVFIVPPSRSLTQRLPLGIMGISSYLQLHGFDNTILDYKGVTEEVSFSKITKTISEMRPSIIGIGCLIFEINIVKELCDYIRSSCPQSIIIIGGPHPTICPEHFVFSKVDFDFLVIGEGEETFLDLVKHILNGEQEKESIKGIAYYKSDKLVFNASRDLIQDLDLLPFPAYDKVNMDYYCRPNVWAIRPVYISGFWMFTSRGCPYSCKFCTAHTIFGKKVRFMSPERIAQHIIEVVRTYHIDGLFFGDESFTVSKERVYKLFDFLKVEKVNILIGFQTRVNLLNEELLVFLKKNNCIQIDLGIESGSDQMLQVMNKGTTLETIRKTGQLCRKIKIRTLANMLINIPGETLEDVQKSLQLAKEMRYNLVLWNVYIPYPGAYLGHELDFDDYNVIMYYPSADSEKLVENKYKFGLYDLPVQRLSENLHKQLAHPKYFKFSMSPKYWNSLFRSVSFIFDYRYWRQILRSKRKIQYIKNILSQKTAV